MTRRGPIRPPLAFDGELDSSHLDFAHRSLTQKEERTLGGAVLNQLLPEKAIPAPMRLSTATTSTC